MHKRERTAVKSKIRARIEHVFGAPQEFTAGGRIVPEKRTAKAIKITTHSARSIRIAAPNYASKTSLFESPIRHRVISRQDFADDAQPRS